ncbi:uncharacterized protein LOC133346396 [Lethenteron reissneri]|uniref:uncharacterized protein LOC133346396 n=1 Tax=Lethenteron reissneri TaxID=7753 RepID=UPI002AB7269D|nr:uncharacterized protein LOC133346396 [Lethenteron reissneri]
MAAVAVAVAPRVDPRADFPAWLSAQGMKLPFAQAMERELGIGDYEDLLACAEDAQVTLELLATARQRLPFALYAALRRLVKTAAGASSSSAASVGPAGGSPRGPPAGGSPRGPPEWPLHEAAQPGLAALLEAIVATLQTLGHELLQSALRFSGLQHALEDGAAAAAAAGGAAAGGGGSEAAASPEARRGEDGGTVLLWPSDDAVFAEDEEEEEVEEEEERGLRVCKTEVVDSMQDAECSELEDITAEEVHAEGLGCSAGRDGNSIYIAGGTWARTKPEPPNHAYADAVSDEELGTQPLASPWQEPPPPYLKMSPDGGVTLNYQYPVEPYEVDGRGPLPHYYQPYQQHHQQAPQGLLGHPPHQLSPIPAQRVRDCEVCGKNRRVPGGRKRTRYWCPGCNVGVHEGCFSKLVHFHRENRRGRRPQHNYEFPRSPMAAAVQ